MATIRLPSDFKEFLRLLNSEKVEYLLVGGYAVGYYGYPRSTGDMDIWIAVNPANAAAIVRALQQFGFRTETVTSQLFLSENKVVRMGIPPVRIDLVTSVEGVDFASCFARRKQARIDDIDVFLIGLDDLKANKKAMGRPKDQDDLEHLSSGQ
jgi:hypothetical protein